MTAPLVIFLGLVGGVLVGDGFPLLMTTGTLRLVGQMAGVTSVYLLPAAVTVVAVGYVTTTSPIPAMLTGVTTAMLAIVALLATVVCTYLSLAVTIVSVHEGPRAGL